MGPLSLSLAHCLNLAIVEGLGASAQTKQTIKKVKTIVKFFKNRAVASAVLRDRQEALGLPTLRLVLENKTRWNSTHDMLARACQMQRP